MPTFMVLASTVLMPDRVAHGRRSYQAGEIVEFSGVPSASLAPMDEEARAASSAARRRRNPDQQRREAIQVARWLRQLPTHLRKRLWPDDPPPQRKARTVPRVPAAPSRSAPPAGVPETFPSGWSTGVR